MVLHHSDVAGFQWPGLSNSLCVLWFTICVLLSLFCSSSLFCPNTSLHICHHVSPITFPTPVSPYSPYPSHEAGSELYWKMFCLWRWWWQLTDGSVESGRAGWRWVVDTAFPRIEVGGRENRKGPRGCFITAESGMAVLSGFEWSVHLTAILRDKKMTPDHHWWHGR